MKSLSFTDHSLLPFVILMSIILCSCAPLCSSKRHRHASKIPGAPLPGRRQPRVDSGKVRACAQIPLRSGDIVFIAVPSYLFRKVASTTNCPYNHVGIVFNDPDRGWLVAESAVPLSRYSPLEKFIARSDHGCFAIRRLKGGLTNSQIKLLRSQCDARMGIVYHTGFRYDSRRMFCSKFVHDVYQSALGVEIGELETFSHLLNRNPQAGLAFWRAWFFGRIPWERITVTPASQFKSRLLETVAI